MLTSTKRFFARAIVPLVSVGALFATTPASAAAAVFFPRGSHARVDRHHVTVSLSANRTVVWDAVDIGGSGVADVGVLVAVRAGGRVEITGRAWIEVIEATTRVNVSIVPSGSCHPTETPGAGTSGQVDASVRVSAEGELSGGCKGGSESSRTEGSGGCVSNSSTPSGGCGGCESCEPSEHGHPGCSAIAMGSTTSSMGCGPIDPNDFGGSSGRTTRPDGTANDTPRIGPYEAIKVSAADGSAQRWIETNGYEPGPSFDEAVAAVEHDGYELVAIRALDPTSSSVIQSLRVVTTSATPALPLRLMRMGSGTSALTPLTLVVLASVPQQLVGATVRRVDVSRLAATGSTSNYEALASALLGDVSGTGDSGHAGTPDDQASRWLFESARTISNGSSPRSTSNEEAGTNDPASLVDLFRSQCGERSSVKHAVCTHASGGEEPELFDGGDGEAGPSDAGATPDAEAGTSDAAPPFTACPDVERQRCDDLDLAIAPDAFVVATRFRGLVGGDPARIADLTVAAATDPLPDGRYVIRDDGEPGLCDLSSASETGDPKTNDDGAQTCRQTARPPRRGLSLGLGSLVTILFAARSIAAIMRRAKSRAG